MNTPSSLDELIQALQAVTSDSRGGPSLTPTSGPRRVLHPSPPRPAERPAPADAKGGSAAWLQTAWLMLGGSAAGVAAGVLGWWITHR